MSLINLALLNSHTRPSTPIKFPVPATDSPTIGGSDRNHGKKTMSGTSTPKRPGSAIVSKELLLHEHIKDSSGSNLGSNGTPGGTPKRPKSAPMTYVISPRPNSENRLNDAPVNPSAGASSGNLSTSGSAQQLHGSSVSSLNISSSRQIQQTPVAKGVAHFRFSSKIHRLGMSRPMKSSISFERILAGNWSEIDRVFLGKYHLHPVESIHFRPRKVVNKRPKVQVHDAVFDEVGAAVERISREANRRRRKFRTLCLQNPFLPSVYKNYIWVTSAMENLLSECFANDHQRYVWGPRLAVLSLGLFPAFLLLFLLMGILFGGLIGVLWDLFTMRYFLRFSGYEKRWITQMLAENPDLDGPVIDAYIKDEYQKACDTLMKQYPDSDLRVWSGVERFEHWNIVFETYHSFKDEFFIIINPPSESYGQLLYHI